jgi:hypothetical protein
MKNPEGRPKIEFDEKDWKLLNVCCQFKHYEEDIASLLDVSLSTMKRRIRERYDCSFEQYRRKILSRTKQNLFQKQYEVAMSGNVSMLIWLGKQWCGQTDKVENHHMIDELSFVDPDDESESNEE